MRVGIVSVMHESNTFAPGPTGLGAFAADTLLSGEAVRGHYAGTHHEVGGFFGRLAEEGVEAVPLFAAWTMPSGTLAAECAGELTRRVLESIRAAGPLDGLLVAPHGAAVAEGEPDFDGFWLSAVRRLVGPSLPVIVTLDLHANVSARMARAADALFIYRTNPHIDQRQTGMRAATLMAKVLRGEARPTSAAVLLPMVANIESQGTSLSPCRELYELAEAMRRRPGVLEVGLALGFPYADVPEMGTAVTVTTDGDPQLARALADELALEWWRRREQFRGDLIAVEEAVRRASTAPGPVCLLDMGDNVGGGGPADSTVVAHELVRQNLGPSLVCVTDPDAARLANLVGVGGTIAVAIGGNSGPTHGVPLPGPFRVRATFESGVFTESEARHGGLSRYDQGPCAVVESGGLVVLVNSRRTAPLSLAQLTAFGVRPAVKRVIVAKGVHAPTAAYAPVCPTLIRVNSTGVTSADLSHFEYKRRRRPLWPFEEFDWAPGGES